MSEWLKELVLKTSVPKGTVGSNPTPTVCDGKGSGCLGGRSGIRTHLASRSDDNTVGLTRRASPLRESNPYGYDVWSRSVSVWFQVFPGCCIT